MVRVNIISPAMLSDQHLVAEYNEIFMLRSYLLRYPNRTGIPREYRLGEGHMRFFQDKALYLKKRHDALRAEMALRGFTARKRFKLAGLKAFQRGDWTANERDVTVIMRRITDKMRVKPDFYRYYGTKRSLKFWKHFYKM